MNYKGIGHVSTLVCVGGLVGVLLLASIGAAPELCVEDCFDPVKMVQWVATGAYFLAFWAYAKAKGRSGWFGLVLSLFSVVGIVVLARAADLSNGPVDRPCPACGGVNFLDAQTCRYCSDPMVEAGGGAIPQD
jgi:hypothetical protein